MPPRDPAHRAATAAHLRDLAARVEAGDVEGVFVVATPPRTGPAPTAHLALLGPGLDEEVAAELLATVNHHTSNARLYLGRVAMGAIAKDDDATR
jgi:hypothetical protein